MKVISWNCNEGFRNKIETLLSLDADVYCIQECESPEKHNRLFKKKLGDHNILWKGEDPQQNKGVAIITHPELNMKQLYWPGNTLRDFLPVSITDMGIVIINTWACKQHIKQFHKWLDVYCDTICGNEIIIGDLNSNAIWDSHHPGANHTQAVARLAKKGMVSAYHHMTGENQGEESAATFFMYRHADKPYHIDYAFSVPDIITSFYVTNNEWLEYSDHVSVILEIDETTLKHQVIMSYF